MPPHKVSLRAHKTLCSGTTAFYFDKPDGFQFEAGQFVNFTLLGPGETDLEGNTRALSIASAFAKTPLTKRVVAKVSWPSAADA